MRLLPSSAWVDAGKQMRPRRSGLGSADCVAIGRQRARGVECRMVLIQPYHLLSIEAWGEWSAVERRANHAR